MRFYGDGEVETKMDSPTKISKSFELKGASQSVRLETSMVVWNQLSQRENDKASKVDKSLRHNNHSSLITPGQSYLCIRVYDKHPLVRLFVLTKNYHMQKTNQINNTVLQ